MEEAAGVVVVPDGLKAADAAEGGELDDEVGVDAEEVEDDVEEAIGSGAVNGGGLPLVVAGALPTQGEELQGGHVKES
ncbi:hypothetical protein MLD38_002442 [Melastoma candidum]|uniref:Uncharacterized protein n=1 Tax=Melastoma candidum TaxID=119954 RepID=A0ACB9S1A4_9MYRT|nr:hypothetical protein MLD38_002442 [Melastoma candidum]